MKKSLIDRFEEVRGDQSQREFAKTLGIHLNTYTNWLRGDGVPSVDSIVRVCTNKCVSADWLLGLDSGDSSGGCAGCRERDAALAALSDTVRHLTEALRRGKGA